ncbi:MAG: hypothetical protein PHR82_02300 [Endomicrobiaceae bacterium]|nr:hypothetical protein [Endomicrobiaceae bacterium]
MKNLLLLFLILFVSSCASGPVYKQDYDFSKIKTAYVESSQSSNNAVLNAIIKQLMIKGFNVKTTDSVDVDIIVNCVVTEYQPSRKYLVRKPPEEHNHTRSARDIVIYNTDPIEISGSSVYDLGSAFGMDANIIASNATVGASLYIKDAKTGDIVWTNSYTYEGLDLSSAIDGVVRYILKSFPPIKK